ncbi:type II secretion system minor pseudopilin GspK [Noviherbaspirillum soli]|uniref:type II secretion system minor pseudopilin GspK n=1 Tax=Noviherbaspirillum soli TaxID=1064518 RepID=UPI001889E135|nr:type II secretion system minor pseudopilin GspK [Noviherbaspirillum soli]
MACRRHHYRQRGVAVVTALLLTTLAVTIVASLFWQQQVQVRSIENQRLQLQKQWILRGALDWARLILRENARLSNYDSLDQPWAVPLLDTRLDQYVENNRADTESSDATLSGQMVDAQSLYNLTNLAPNGQIVEKEVKIFARLLASQRLNPSLAQDTAAMVAASVPRQPLPAASAAGAGQDIDPLTGLPRANANTNANAGAAGNQGTATVTVGSQRLMPMTQVEDLLAIPGFTPEAVEKLRNLVIFLPQGGTSLNINTAPVEVLAAVIENISTSDAAVIVATRTTASFRSKETIANQLPGIPTVGSSNLDVYSNYFLVNGRVKLNRAALQIQALMKRNGRGPSAKTQLVWIREN